MPDFTDAYGTWVDVGTLSATSDWQTFERATQTGKLFRFTFLTDWNQWDNRLGLRSWAWFRFAHHDDSGQFEYVEPSFKLFPKPQQMLIERPILSTFDDHPYSIRKASFRRIVDYKTYPVAAAIQPNQPTPILDWQLKIEYLKDEAIAPDPGDNGDDSGTPDQTSAALETRRSDVWQLSQGQAVAIAPPEWGIPFYATLPLSQPGEGVQFQLTKGAFLGLASDIFHDGWWNFSAAWFAAGSTTFRAIAREEFNLAEVVGANLTFRILIGENNSLLWQSKAGDVGDWQTYYSQNNAFLGTLFVYGTGAISGTTISNIVIENIG